MLTFRSTRQGTFCKICVHISLGLALSVAADILHIANLPQPYSQTRHRSRQATDMLELPPYPDSNVAGWSIKRK